MDRLKFEDEVRALDVCAKCLDENAKPRLSLLRCTGCRMVLYCSKAHQTEHWRDHKAFCKARKKLVAKSAVSGGPKVPQLPSPHCLEPDAEEAETYVSVCDATGVFCILGMFWKGCKANICNLSVRLGQGPIACLLAPLPDGEPRTRLAALKTLTVQGGADYVRVSTATAACMAQAALNERRGALGKNDARGVEDLPSSDSMAGINMFLRAAKTAAATAAVIRENKSGSIVVGNRKTAGATDEQKAVQDYLASEAHESFKKALLECYDGGKSLDVFYFGLLNERREFRDCFSFLEGLASLGGAETFEKALQKLDEQGGGETRRGTVRLCAHACLCFFQAGLSGLASAINIAKEGCEEDFKSSPFVRAMLYRTMYKNAAGEVVASPRPELAEKYREDVLEPLMKAQESTGQALLQLTPVSLEIKSLLEQGVLL